MVNEMTLFQNIALLVNLMEEEMLSDDGGSDPVRWSVMKTLTKMAGEAAAENTSGTSSKIRKKLR